MSVSFFDVNCLPLSILTQGAGFLVFFHLPSSFSIPARIHFTGCLQCLGLASSHFRILPSSFVHRLQSRKRTHRPTNMQVNTHPTKQPCLPLLAGFIVCFIAAFAMASSECVFKACVHQGKIIPELQCLETNGKGSSVWLAGLL